MNGITREHVNACDISHWYPIYKSVSIKTSLIDIPNSFIKLLLEDKIIVPNFLISNPNDHTNNVNIQDFNELKQFQNDINTNINTLNGKIFCKLNWSSPKDAKWMIGTLCCKTFEDIFLLLKSSDFILHDLTQPYDYCKENKISNIKNNTINYVLTLRKWCNMYDSMHFRCFIINNKIKAISQRMINETYNYLINEIKNIKEIIIHFYNNKIKTLRKNDKYNYINDYVMDIYIDKKDKVYLTDFNIFSNQTNPLLFTWEEIYSYLQDDTIHIRINNDSIENDNLNSKQSNSSFNNDPLHSYRVPIDFMNIVSIMNNDKQTNKNNVSESLIDFLTKQEIQSDHEKTDENTDSDNDTFVETD